MEQKSKFFLPGLILAVALPAVLSVTAYQITKNPALRPLARTEDDVAIYKGTISAHKIVAHIRWPTKREKNFTQEDLKKTIARAFNAHGVRVYVDFEEVNTSDRVSITYQVGRNTLGPHPITKAADSINGAIAVYRMYKMHQR